MFLDKQLQITRELEGYVAILKTPYATPQLSEIRLSVFADAYQTMLYLMTDIGVALPEDVLFLRTRLLRLATLSSRY